MKFYKMGRGGEEIHYPEPTVFQESPWFEEDFFMNRCEHKHELPIPYYVTNRYDPLDFPLSHNKLVSESFLNLIKKLNTEYESFESKLYYEKKEEMWGPFYTMLFPEYELFNWDKSEYEIDDGIICSMDKIVLDKSKTENLNIKNNIFILKELPTKLLCTEIAKKAIEDAGLKGMTFKEIEVM